MTYKTTIKIKTKFDGEISQGPISLSYTELTFSGEGNTKAEAVREAIGKIQAHYGLMSAVQEAPETPEFLLKNCTRCDHSENQSGGHPNDLFCKYYKSPHCFEMVDSTKFCPEWREMGEKR